MIVLNDHTSPERNVNEAHIFGTLTISITIYPAGDEVRGNGSVIKQATLYTRKGCTREGAMHVTKYFCQANKHLTPEQLLCKWTAVDSWNAADL